MMHRCDELPDEDFREWFTRTLKEGIEKDREILESLIKKAVALSDN